MRFHPIRYEEPVFRPPGEAGSLLLQVTIGCSHNRCTFCSMYRGKRYRVRSLDEISAELRHAAACFGEAAAGVRKLFLCDGDALSAPAELLAGVCEAAGRAFPRLRRVGVYASAGNVLVKEPQELARLAQVKLSIAYLGLESGSDEVLRAVAKGNTAAELCEAAARLRQAGWQISLIVMLGLQGRAVQQDHRRGTLSAINEIAPDFLSFLTTVAVPGTPYAAAVERGEIAPLSCLELLEEMRFLVEHIEGPRRGIIFRANHVSNQFPLEGRLPRDRSALLAVLDSWIAKCPPGLYPQSDPFLL